MKQMKLGLLLALLALFVIACGGIAPEPTDAPPEPVAEESAEEVAEEEAPAEEAEGEMAEDESITIGMMKIVSHPALDAIQGSFLETLAEGGYVEGKNLTVIDGNAEGDIATLTTIAQQFVDEGVDLIATTSTPALQAAFNVTQDMENPIPIIFNAVTSPYAAGVATAPDDHPAWVLGTQIFPPVAMTFEIMGDVFPDQKVIGYLYNPAEANSVAQHAETVMIADELGYTLEVGTVSNSSEVKTAAEALVVRDIDIFYFGQDSTVASGVEGLYQVANDNVLPVITNDISVVPRGAAFGVGLEFIEDGIRSGEYAVDFLNGELDIATAPIIRFETTEIHYNTVAAEAQGLTLPASILDNGIDKTPE